MRLTGVNDYKIDYSLVYGDCIINRTSVVMKSCHDKKHALSMFNIYIRDRKDELNDTYIHSIELV